MLPAARRRAHARTHAAHDWLGSRHEATHCHRPSLRPDGSNLQGFGKSLKTKAEDLIEGKVTAPVIRALMALGAAGDAERQRWLWGQFGVPDSEREITRDCPRLPEITRGRRAGQRA